MITFRSWGGLWVGGDADIELTFFPNARVHLIYFGFVIDESGGTYDINDAGLVTIALEDYPVEWPVMMLQRDATSLLLLPQDAGKPTSEEVERFWAYRPVSAADQARIRKQYYERMRVARILSCLLSL